MQNVAHVLINLKETIKLLWRHRNKCQNSGDIFKYITASYRLDSASSFNNIEGIRSLQNCSRWLACYILGSLKVKQSKVSNNWLFFSNNSIWVNSAHPIKSNSTNWSLYRSFNNNYIPCTSQQRPKLKNQKSVSFAGSWLCRID